ncbi:MAG: hypothetical protein ACTHN3_06075 [Solirubrobacterales bacterium]
MRERRHFEHLRRKVETLVLLALATGLVVAAPASAASQATFEKKVEVSLSGSNGYRITVSGEPLRGLSHLVILSAETATMDAFYIVPGHVSETSLRANLGALGQISLRYHPRGKKPLKNVPERCFTGGSSESRTHPLTLHGTIRFTGENGYTSLLAHRAQGVLREKLTCGEAPLGPRSPGHSHYPILATHSQHGPTFIAGHFPLGGLRTEKLPGGPLEFLAIEIQSRHRMQIFRTAAVGAPLSDFTYDSALTSATVTPPPPFSGSAQFERLSKGSISWSGTLSVAFPGHDSVPLTGPFSTAELERE